MRLRRHFHTSYLTPPYGWCLHLNEGKFTLSTGSFIKRYYHVRFYGPFDTPQKAVRAAWRYERRQRRRP